MANKPQFVPHKIKLSLVVDGITITDIVGVTATFELNGIPVAVVDLAAGINMKKENPSSASSGALNGLKLRSPAQIIMTVLSGGGDDDVKDPGLPTGEHIIFDGYYVGTGWSRTRDEAHFQVHLIHWIDDLNCSSMINGNYSPGMPGDLAQAAVLQTIQMITTTKFGTAVRPFIDDLKPFANIWADNLKPLLLYIASLEHFKAQAIGLPASGKSGNDAAAAALARMSCDANVGTTLKLDGGPIPVALASSFRNSMTDLIVNNMGYMSFWAKLVGELCPEFLLAISPAVMCANVIPFFGGLSERHVTISANEYNVARFNCHATNLIESVNLFHSMEGTFGVGQSGKTPSQLRTADYYTPFGWYPKGDNRDKRGFVMVKRPPRWLANAAPQGGVISSAVFLQQDSHTGSRNNSRQPPNGIPDKRSGQASFSGMADNYAEHWYKTSVLAQRQGELSGKLRFDIAPGSIVEIELPPDHGGEEGPTTYFGAVMSVSYVINSDRPIAGTSFTFTALRTKEENKNPILTSPRAPLYTTGWPGGPLSPTAGAATP